MSNNSSPNSSFLVRGSHLLIMITLIILGLYLGQSVLVPLVFAAFLASLVLPIVRRLTKCCLPDWLSALLGVVAVIFAGLLFFGFMSWQVRSFVDDSEGLNKAITEKRNDVLKYVESHYHVSRREQRNWLDEKYDELWNKGSSKALDFFTATGTVLATMFIIPIFMFFLLLYREKFKQFVLMLNVGSHRNVSEIFREVATVAQKYVRGMSIVIIILAILNSIGFMLLGLKFAILLGFLAAVLNIIPYVGVLIGSLIPVGIALITKDSIMSAVGALGVCVFVQFLENNFITPKIVGSSVKINPLAALIALLLGGLIWGLPGMVLAIPLAGIMKVICDRVEPLQPYGFLIGEEVQHKPKRFRRKAASKPTDT